ncbi:hypothetical protein [Pantoea sp. B65]|uniref:hypothetical protein n=1 Tax=Pantoea sp. B65 TaxID=2813359 RepID=UPI0039B65CA0
MHKLLPTTESTAANDALLRQFRLIARMEGVSQQDMQRRLMARYVNSWLTENLRYQVVSEVTPDSNLSRQNLCFNISVQVIGLELTTSCCPVSFDLPAVSLPYEAWRVYAHGPPLRSGQLIPATDHVAGKKHLLWQGRCFIFDPQLRTEITFRATQRELQQKLEQNVHRGIQQWANHCRQQARDCRDPR